MKRIKKIMILLLLLIPFMVHAETIKKTYDTAVTRANNYIGGFQNKERYILSNSNIYGFTTSGVTNNSSFTNGGLLTSLEYQTSVSNNHSWLETGSEYWTQTQTSEGRAYIDAGIQYKGDDNTSGVRVTEFIIPDVRVRGTGSASNPWQFVEQYTVRISKNRNDSGLGLTVEKATVQSGEDDKITITETTGLMYTGEDDCGLTYSGSLSKYVKEYYLRDIQRDINCVANFDVRRVTVKYDCDGGTGAPADQRIVYGTAYTLAGKSCTKDGFIQTGWKAGSTNYALSASGTSWNVEEGEGGVSNGVLNLKAVYNDVQAPTVTVTAYKYDSTKTNGLGDKINDPVTVTETTTNTGTVINKTATYQASSNWLNHAVVFKVESTDNQGVESITFKYNNANSATDTGDSYPTTKDKGTTQVQYPSFNTAGNGQGWRNGQWIVKDAKGNTTTVKLVAKIDTTAPTCTLGVTEADGVKITRNDNLAVNAYGLIKSTTETYNSTQTLALSNGTFYGYVKDNAGNKGTCQVNLTGTVDNKWTKKSEKCISYKTNPRGTYTQSNSCSTSTCSTSGCSCGGYTASGTYTTSYTATASYSGTIKCYKYNYTCSEGYISYTNHLCNKPATSTPSYKNTGQLTGYSCSGCSSSCSSIGYPTYTGTCYQYSTINKHVCRCSKTTYSCSGSGWSLSGSNCYKAATQTKEYTNITCNTKAKYDSPASQCIASSLNHESNTCTRTYSCPNGGSRSGSTCYVSHNCTTGTCGTSGCSCYYTTASGTYNTYPSCTTSTCSKSGCSCDDAYKFDTATTATNQTACTSNSISCNASTNGQTKVTCTATGWTCEQSGYTLLNSTYCYK